MMPVMPRVDLGRPATYDDLLAVPDILVAEILDGELWTSPKPTPRHAEASSSALALLKPAFDFGWPTAGGWHILAEPELHLEHHVVVPDLAGWWRTRMPHLPETAFFALAPDWVCEVLSPSTEMLDRGRKLRVYAQHRVRHSWLVDPLERTLEALRLDDDRWIRLAMHAGRVLVRVEPFDEVPIDLALLWGDEAYARLRLARERARAAQGRGPYTWSTTIPITPHPGDTTPGVCGTRA